MQPPPPPLVYRFGAGNGADPTKCFARKITTDILCALPLTFQDIKDDSITRILLHGAPGSGKTSILGVVDKQLRERFGKDEVFFVPCSEYETNESEQWKQIRDKIRANADCVVILDDAQKWYDFDDFWGLFKSGHRILVAAATYSVAEFNRDTPVDIQFCAPAALLPIEVGPLLQRLNIDQQHHAQITEWFGNHYGRMHILVPKLFAILRELRVKDPNTSLSAAYFRGSTMTAMSSSRIMPSLQEDMRELLMKVWNGQANGKEKNKLVRYGVLNDEGGWVCDFVRRMYFTELFHTASRAGEWNVFDEGIPSPVTILVKGLQELCWPHLKKCSGSSTSGFPIEDIWQTHFYGGIGQFIPKNLTFCKEYVTGTEHRVDFVLRNGSTIAIELLIRSSKVEEHHQRFDTGGAYYHGIMGLDDYLVVDISPWNQDTDILDVSDDRCIAEATKYFDRIDIDRRAVHAVFLVANNKESGILYTYDPGESKAKVAARCGAAS